MYVRGNFITELYFTIYDRWGEKVFETTDQNKGWDGKFKGRDCDPAVYVYYLEMTCEGGFTYFEKGNITLIR
jgi:gliding motility-associated-like protein